MTVIRQDDFIDSVADALQFISYYHPLDFVQAVTPHEFVDGVPGTLHLDVSLQDPADAEQRTALVVFDDAVTTVEAITAASTNAGYEATVVEGNS